MWTHMLVLSKSCHSKFQLRPPKDKTDIVVFLSLSYIIFGSIYSKLNESIHCSGQHHNISKIYNNGMWDSRYYIEHSTFIVNMHNILWNIVDPIE